jgi:hypothetical protein
VSEVVEFYWPGDPWISVVQSPLRFGSAVRTAERTAEELSAYLNRRLRSRRQIRHLRFVGHSLGCRVILETLMDVRFPTAARSFDHVVLMAAAVGENQVSRHDWSGKGVSRLLRSLKPAADRPATTWTVLHSTHDSVLLWAFPGGEVLSGEIGVGDAVGLAGGPTWNPGPQKTAIDLAPYDHGDYWTAQESVETIARVVFRAPVLARVRGHVVPCRSGVPKHDVPRYDGILADGR